jgi:radical SAM superfamily enzyme YgiQ (UPF0313 family)
MRVTLIIPPSGFLLDELVFPTLGILKVAAVLEQAGHVVDVWDFAGVQDLDSAVKVKLRAEQSDVYGITATSPQMPQALQIVSLLSKYVWQSLFVLGGPHVTLMQASARQGQAKRAPGRASAAIQDLGRFFDVLVCGDGETAMFEAMKLLVSDIVFKDRATIIDADDPYSSLFLTSAQLNDLPLPARHLIDLDRYHYAIEGHRAQSLIAQLGCPMGCQFCGGRRSPFLRKIRTRDTAHVMAEMRHLYERYGTTGFMFFDDELNVNKAFMGLLQSMQDLQAELGVDFRMRGFLKAELITEPMVQAMAQAGFRKVLVGCESGHPRILANIRKNATRDENTRCAALLEKYGIALKAAMSIGHPGESEETIEATRSWLLDVQPAEFDVSIITVYPGTPYFDDAREHIPGIWTYTDRKNGDRLHAYHVDYLRDQSFYKGAPGAYRSFVFTDALTASDLCELRDDVEDEVRRKLQIPYPTAASATFEHSMGQS